MTRFPCWLQFAVAVALLAQACAMLQDSDPVPLDGKESEDLYRAQQLRVPQSEAVELAQWEVACGKYEPFVEGCHPTTCKRVLMDGFVAAEEAEALLDIARTALAVRGNEGGPAIVDIASGFIRDSQGMVNIHEAGPSNVAFTPEQFFLYADVLDRIRRQIMQRFGLATLYYTAPTFITRLTGSPAWEPAGVHDEYWHAHVDKENTPHYDYSGLLYLTDYGVDFEGGLFRFFDDDQGDQVIEPRKGAARCPCTSACAARWLTRLHVAGRLLMFTAGTENLHRVRGVSRTVCLLLH